MAVNQSSSTVIVGCKLPHGIVLRAFRKTEIFEPILNGGGSRKVDKWEPTGEEFVVNGNAHSQVAAPRSQIAFGYALTPNVPKEIWEQWYAANKDSDMVRNGMIFAHSEQRSVEAEAREKEKLRTGMERLDPMNLPPDFKGKIKTFTQDPA